MSTPRASARAWRATAASALAEVRARPLHAALAALVVGLLAGPRAPLVVLAALLACALLARRPAGALLVAGALLGGAVLADARLAALDRTVLTDRLGHAATVRVWLLEAARPRAFGGRTADRPARARAGARPHERPGRLAARVRVGQELAIEGVLEALRPADAWLRPRNVHAVLRADRVAPTGRARGAVSPGCSTGSASAPQAALDRGLPPPQAALLRGMVLGQDEALPGAHARGLPDRRALAPRGRERPERDAALRARVRPVGARRPRLPRAAAPRARAHRAVRPARGRRAFDPARGRHGRRGRRGDAGRAARVALVRAAARGRASRSRSIRAPPRTRGGS